MSLRDYFYYGLEFHDTPVDRLTGVVHTHYLGTCFSRVYKYEIEDLDLESEAPYELAKESIIEEIIQDLVRYMEPEETYYIVDTDTHAMNIISLSKAESDNAGEGLPEDDIWDEIESESEYKYDLNFLSTEPQEEHDEFDYYFKGGQE